MESVAVFLVGIAVIWLVFWIVKNDGAATLRDQRGLFRMRPPAEPPAQPGAAPGGPGGVGPGGVGTGGDARRRVN